MNRLLLQECLDELRSDDSVELTEAHNNRRKDKKIRGTRGSVPARHSRHLEPNLEDAPLVPPTPVDPNAEQNLASLAQRLAQGEHLSPVNFLREVCEALGYVEKQVDESGNPKKLNPNHSVYFVNQLNGREFHLRMANHRATVNEFARREEWENNTGIVLKMSDKPLIPDSRVDYIEYVFLPPLLIQEKKQDIVLGIIDWVKTGNYSGPIGDMKPGISRRRKPFKMKKPTFSNTPQPPATPPDEPGVKESLAKYFRGTHNMKYRLLKEAALRELDESYDWREHGWKWGPNSPAAKVDTILRNCYEELDSLCREVNDSLFLSFVTDRIKERLVQDWKDGSHGAPRNGRLVGSPHSLGPEEYESEPAYIYGHG